MRLAASACLLALLGAVTAAAAQKPQEEAPPIIVEADAVARSHIERILEADNLDTGRLAPNEVVAAMRAIPRGRAPEDFWTAYQAHVRAWERFAAAAARAEALARENPAGLGKAATELDEADRAIGTSFDEVERIARRYGARIPIPVGEPALPTV